MTTSNEASLLSNLVETEVPDAEAFMHCCSSSEQHCLVTCNTWGVLSTPINEVLHRGDLFVWIGVDKHCHRMSRSNAIVNDSVPSRLHPPVGETLKGFAEGDDQEVWVKRDRHPSVGMSVVKIGVECALHGAERGLLDLHIVLAPRLCWRHDLKPGCINLAKECHAPKIIVCSTTEIFMVHTR